MKAFLLLGLAFACAAAPAARNGGRTSALGGSAASRGAMSHPLGGFTSTAPRASRGTARVYPYGFSWYVPSYFGLGDYGGYGAYDPNYYGAPAPPPDAQ